MLSNSRFIQDRMEDLQRYNEQHSQGIRVPSTEAKALDPVVKLIGLHQSYESIIAKARMGVIKTISFTENEDGTVAIKPFDIQAFRSFSKVIDDYSKRLMAVEGALEQLEKIENLGYYADCQRARDASKSKVNHLQQKLEQLQHSTRHSEADMRAAQKEVKQQISDASVELQRHQSIVDRVDAILAEVQL